MSATTHPASRVRDRWTRSGLPSPATVARAAGPGGAVLAAGVLVQIVYPLVNGRARDALTIAIVLLIAAGCVVHAAVTRGVGTAAALLLVTAPVGFAAELVGVHTGVPFGSYRYTGGLGPGIADVPLLIGPAWTMMAWPAAAAARRLATGHVSRILLGAWALTAWDVALDPQMVADGHWRWTSVPAHLPGVPEIPLSNWLGWFVVALVISAAVRPLLDRRAGHDAGPLALYLWTAASSVLLLLVFLPHPAAAGWTALAMGSVAVPLAWKLAGQPARRQPSQ